MFRSSPTSKILHIVRHGKAISDNWRIIDVDRTLTEKGIINNTSMATKLCHECDTPDLIISSPAIRAFHTALIFARHLKYSPEKIRIIDAFYLDGLDTALEVLKELSDEITSVMFVGHNPDMTYLVNVFFKEFSEALPTSGMVTIRFDTTQWCDIEQVKSKSMVNFPKPKEI